MTFRFRETPDKIIVFFSNTRIFDKEQIHETGGPGDICDRAVSTDKNVLIDFNGVPLMSSAMIADLFRLVTQAKQYSLRLRLANLAPNVLEVLKMARLTEFFGFDDDGPDVIGSGVPNPKPPNTLDGRAKPPSG